MLEHDTWNTTVMVSRSCTVCPEVHAVEEHTLGNVIISITTVIAGHTGEKLSEIERLYAIIEKFKKEVGCKILHSMALPCKTVCGWVVRYSNMALHIKRTLKICVL